MFRSLLGFITLSFAAAASSVDAHAQLQAPLSDARDGTHLVIAKPVAEHLGSLADSLEVETIRCLIGITRGGSAVVDLVWEPERDRSSPDAGALCPLATIAVWHNRVQRSLEDPERACFLRAADIRGALDTKSPRIQIVQVSAEVACWWTRDQIEQSADADTLMSLPGQRRGTVRAPAACRGGRNPGRVCARAVVFESGRLPVRWFTDS